MHLTEEHVRPRRVSFCRDQRPSCSTCTYPFALRETEPDWHKELQADVKDECEAKYGKVEAIKVEVESQVSEQFNALILQR